MPCMSTIIDFSKVVKLKNIVVKTAITGKRIILKELRVKASAMFVYFLP